MLRANRRACALGAVLLALAGCVVPDQFRLNYLENGLLNGDREVAASLDVVSESAQSGLRRLGMRVEETAQGKDLRLLATTPGGDQFAVVLARVQTPTGERTRVRVEGASSQHEKILFQIVTQAEQAGASAK